MARPSAASRRAAEQAARHAAEQAQRQARRRRLIGAGCAALAVLLVLAAVVFGLNRDEEADAPVASGPQLEVPNAAPGNRGITLTRTPAGKPLVVVVEDYQCPWCMVAEQSIGKQLQTLAGKGELGLEVRSITLLDTMANNDSSLRANLAASCADVVGRYPAYRDAVFAHQPQKEGDGYTDEQLRVEIPAATGIQGDELTRLQGCYDQRRSSSHVDAVIEKARAAKLDTSTPQYWVAGADGTLKNKLDLQELMGTSDPTEQQLLDAIMAAS